LDKLAQQEGSEVRPHAAFHPVPVSAYIQDSLSPQTSPLSPYLSMGLASIALAQNSAISNGERWVDQIELDRPRRDESAASLAATLKRLGEELSGQKGRAHVGVVERRDRGAVPRDAGIADAELAIEPPFVHAPTAASADEVRPSNTTPAQSQSQSQSRSPEPAVPTSIPVLLHLVGKLVGGVMHSAMTRVGASATPSVASSVELGPLDEVEDDGNKTTRVRSTVSSDGRLHQAWIGKSSIFVAREKDDGTGQVETAVYKLATSDGSPIKVFDLEFVEARELLVAIETTGSTGPRQLVTSLALESLSFSSDPLPENLPLCPLEGAITLESHFPPSQITITTVGDRRIACTLAGEGRRLEFHQLESSPNNGDGMELA
ncbi:hypothetical protein JCM11491_005618, partial [Sporobolomyces phaffii]